MLSSVNLEAILQTVLASAASAAIVAYLAKSLVPHWLDKDVEKLHAVVRNWHQSIDFWQIITSNARADTIKDADQEKRAEGVEYERRAREATEKLEAFYYPRAIWLEPDLCVLINKLIEGLTILFHMLDAEARGRPFHTKDGDPRAVAGRVLER